MPKAIALAMTLLRDRTAAEDVVHDCYCRLLAKREVYDLPRDGLKILRQAVAHACINHNSRARLLLRLRLPDDGEHDDGPNADLPDGKAIEPLTVLMTRELQAAIDAGLSRLPPAQRAALELKSLGHSLQEIADALGVSPANAAVLVHRARKSLGERLAPHLREATG
jgi:RNA polymerase sigma-70 factor (ECF subfamily)